jgi:hypothetical protein
LMVVVTSTITHYFSVAAHWEAGSVSATSLPLL